MACDVLMWLLDRECRDTIGISDIQRSAAHPTGELIKREAFPQGCCEEERGHRMESRFLPIVLCLQFTYIHLNPSDDSTTESVVLPSNGSGLTVVSY